MSERPTVILPFHICKDHYKEGKGQAPSLKCLKVYLRTQSHSSSGAVQMTHTLEGLTNFLEAAISVCM